MDPDEKTNISPRWDFGGTYLTPELMAMLIVEREVTPTSLALYLIIQSLDGPKGCWASNAYLAAKLGLQERQIRNNLAKLKQLGLVVQTAFDGRRRTLKAIHPQDCTGGLAKAEGQPQRTSERQSHCRSQRQDHCRQIRDKEIGDKSNGEVSKETSLSGFATGRNGGFDLVEEKSDNAITDFDLRIAIELQAAVAKIPERKTGPRKHTKPSTWAKSIRLLRTQDGRTEDEIATAMKWYATAIGKRFAPEAYSGEAFRKKFHAIYSKAERGAAAATPPGPIATRIAAEYVGAPAIVAALPGAVQATIDRYTAWRARLRTFAERVAADDLTNEYDEKVRNRINRNATELLARMPPPDYYGRAWADRTVRRVAGWQGWSGDFTPFILDTASEEFDEEVARELGTYVGSDHGTRAWAAMRKMMQDESI